MEKYFLEWSNIKNHTLSVVIPAQAGISVTPNEELASEKIDSCLRSNDDRYY